MLLERAWVALPGKKQVTVNAVLRAITEALQARPRTARVRFTGQAEITRRRIQERAVG